MYYIPFLSKYKQISIAITFKKNNEFEEYCSLNIFTCRRTFSTSFRFRQTFYSQFCHFGKQKISCLRCSCICGEQFALHERDLLHDEMCYVKLRLTFELLSVKYHNSLTYPIYQLLKLSLINAQLPKTQKTSCITPYYGNMVIGRQFIIVAQFQS